MMAHTSWPCLCLAQWAVLIAALAAAFTSAPAAAWVNNFDATFDYSCSAFVGVTSEHSNLNEDRRWSFTCDTLGAGSSTPTTFFTGYYSEGYYDQAITYSCGTDLFLNRLQSQHSNNYEDRIFAFGCASAPGAKLFGCTYTGYLNGMDGLLNFNAASNQVLAGLSSYHDSGPEDRVWRVRYCEVGCDLDGNYINDATNPRQCTALTTATLGSDIDFENAAEETFASECPDFQAMKIFYSEYDSATQDRLFQLGCSAIADGGSFPRNAWSSATYGNLQAFFDFTCPPNTFVTGMRSQFISSSLDRAYSFQCSSAPNTDVSTTTCITTTRNSLYATVDVFVNETYAITGVNALYDTSGNVDRQFSLTACQLECHTGFRLDIDGVCRVGC
ncbi:hypothetical protein PTSG_05975 [Salpingoeca rosetta]|uniref:GON domain-containing protein n=1 Tax=Salpingoeca rosetta (strain ATCC 50818 / BSB-021) TaxID=946362 RepID=F2UDB6_SALR5|nr:uncharacterized protein PTSG_05975 [Salpingoeca rosetta]EGD74611.1 hypothetical protein PTSG_05975 [Salpingoeca rosetta]|eukprot:XP_004992868.1 hypothetical protein PTSG_05975 [Salpingoeca rosetta]